MNFPKTNTRHAIENIDDFEFLKKVRDTYQKDVDAERHNIAPAQEDMQFTVGDQWEPETRARRRRLRKPVLTVNRMPAFVAQFLGSWMQTDMVMKLKPLRGGTKKVAEMRQGLIRTIMRTKVAKHAKNSAMTTAYICGVGNFGISLEDAKGDVFTKDICLEAYEDPHQVIWDRASVEPTGADANHCFCIDYMTQDDFKQTYPEATGVSGWVSEDFDQTNMTAHGWEIDEMVRVCRFWQMKERPMIVGLEKETGDVVNIEGWTPEQMRSGLELDQDGAPIWRETVQRYAELYVMTANEVLEGPFELVVSRLPVFRVEGWKLVQGKVAYRWGFVRNAKDPQRLHNYWRSILAEELMKSVSGKWLLDKAGMKNGLADAFRNAHLSEDNVLFWDSQADGAKPERIEPPMVNQAVLSEAGMTVQDIRDVTNKHEASMGMRSNEVSGKAINARQRVSELGDVIYMENMNAALAEAGRVVDELIPAVYDTNRVIKITGEDDLEMLQEINGDFGDATPDITKGKYDMVYDTGPSYATKREEAVETTLTLMNTMPNVASMLADILVRNMDMPGAEEIEERLAGMLPPGVLNPERLPEHRRKRIVEQIERQEQERQKSEAIQMEMLKRQLGEMDAKIEELRARAAKQNAQAQTDPARVQIEAFEAQSQHEIGAAKVAVDGGKVKMEGVKAGLELAMHEQDAERAEEQEKRQQAQAQENPNGNGR